jgi:hypothetical protein
MWCLTCPYADGGEPPGGWGVTSSVTWDIELQGTPPPLPLQNCVIRGGSVARGADAPHGEGPQ